MARHSLDPWPIPKDKMPLFINEPWLIDQSLQDDLPSSQDEMQQDNIRVFIPLDINRNAVKASVPGTFSCIQVITNPETIEITASYKNLFPHLPTQVPGSRGEEGEIV